MFFDEDGVPYEDMARQRFTALEMTNAFKLNMRN